eukprot:g644.t1
MSANWRKLKDSKSGRSYYYNKLTKKTQWKQPEGFVAKEEKTGGTFWEKLDASSNKTYYINSKTRETTWQLPAGAKIVPKPTRKKKKRSNDGTRKDPPTSVSSSSLVERVHIGRDGDIDISESSDILKEKVHIGKDGSVDISETTRTGRQIRSHVSPSGSISISEGGRDVDLDAILKRVGKSKDSLEHVHISASGSIDLEERGGNNVHIDENGGISLDRLREGKSSYSSSSILREPITGVPASMYASKATNGDVKDSSLPMGLSPYDSILMETKSLSSESVALEQECLSLDSQLAKFKSGVKGTLDSVKDLLDGDNDHVHSNEDHCANETSTTNDDHKSLFPLNGYDVGGTILALVGAAFANAGGAGGGGIFVPLLILLVQFTPHGAIPLSKAMIFGGALTFVSITFRRKHPEANKPLIDYDIALMFEPMVLCGTTVGVLLNRVFPSWMLLTLLEILLVTTVYRTFKKGKKKYNEETQRLSSKKLEEDADGDNANAKMENAATHSAIEMSEMKREATASEVVDDETINLRRVSLDDFDDDEEVAKTSSGILTPPPAIDTACTEDENTSKGNESDRTPLSPTRRNRLAEIKTQEARILPVEKIALIGLVWVAIMILALMRGGHGAGSIVGVESCSAGYWVLTFSVFPLSLGVTAWVSVRLRREHQEKVDLGYDFKRGMVKWDARNSVIYPLCCFFAGCAAGLLGIGGGLVLGPLLLEMDVRAEVSAATSSLMVLFTASCTSIQFAILGQLEMDYALWFGAFTSLGAIGGVLAVSYAVQKLGRPSYIILSLGAVIFASAILIPSFAIPDLISDIDEDGSSVLSFHSFCDCAG